MSRLVDPRLLREVPASRRLLTALAVLQSASAVLVVTQAMVLVHIVVRIFTAQVGARSVAAALVLLAGVGLARAGLAAVQEWLTARASLRIRAQLRQRTLQAVVRLGPLWANRQDHGRLVTASGPGLDGLDGYVTRALPAVVAAGVVPPAVLAMIMWTDWQSGLILLGLLPLVPLFMVLVGVVTKRHVERHYALLGKLAAQFVDLLRGMTTLRIYGRAAAQQRRVEATSESLRTHTLATLRVAFLSGLVLDLLAALSVAVVAVDVGLRLDAGHVSLTTALLVLVLAPDLFAPLRALGTQHHAAQDGATAAAAALDIVDEAHALPAAADASTSPHCPEHILLRNVGVTYPGRSAPALVDVDLVLAPRMVTALVGGSGAGKSTVLALLLGLVAPTSGSLAAPDRGSIAWVPQRPRPTKASVGGEVRMGDPAADDAAVQDVCRRCHAPHPDTPMREDGLGVSAGQRRRIALARAVLRARAVQGSGGIPLVLLDEPSEDLDAATEAVVGAALADLRGWATVVVVTHSQALMRLADRVVTLRRGRIDDDTAQSPATAPRPVAVDKPVRRPVERPSAADPTRGVGYRLRDLLRDARAGRRLATACMLAVLAALSGLGLMASSMWLISRAAQHPNVQALAVAVVGVRTFALGRALLRYVERLATHDAALRMLTALRSGVFTALRPLPPWRVGGYGRGELLRRFIGDVDGAQEGLVRAVVPSAGAAASVAGAVTIATLLDPVAGAVLACGLLAAGLLVPLATVRLAGPADGRARLIGERDRRSAALLDGLAEIVAYGDARAALQRISRSDAEVATASRRADLSAALGSGAAGVFAALTLAGVLGAAAHAVHAGQLPVVQLGVLAVCALVSFEAVAALPAAFVAWRRCRAGLDRVSELTNLATSPDATRHAGAAASAPVGLRVRDVTVSPAPDASAVLRAADLEVPAGARVAVVGPSGCGKSTLLCAVLRLLPVSAGRVSVASRAAELNVADLAAEDLPPLVAGSLQGDHVFDTTLRDNLRFVRPAATDAELDDVARRVRLLDDVRALPSGWSTRAGIDGAALSGGQRQRLLVARALLADPAVLVLDEPTAHLDDDLARSLLDDVLRATARRTVLFTSHRRLRACDADRVVAVAGQRMVSVGTQRPEPDAGPDKTARPPRDEVAAKGGQLTKRLAQSR